ncbi:MAG: TetR-like C-terminal domain-containing protein, partial [Clostridium sp.]|nr:TetR-like C-terminal domain-containing protein [Clostridium sp.]
GVSMTLREGLEKKFWFIKNEQTFFAAAFQSEDYNSLVAYDYECILQFYKNIIEKKTKKPLDEDICFLLEMYCRGSIYMTARWARRNMDLAPEKMADLLIQALPQPLEELLSELQPDLQDE